MNKVGSDCLTIPNYVDGSICNKVLLNLEFWEVIEVVIKDWIWEEYDEPTSVLVKQTNGKENEFHKVESVSKISLRIILFERYPKTLKEEVVIWSTDVS